jgi:hypothetical protein
MTENEEQRPNELENQQQTQNDSAIEYSKLPGFDVLEQLPEELDNLPDEA